MPEFTLSELRTEIIKAGHSWLVNEVVPARPHGLGWEPSPDAMLQFADVSADQFKKLRLPVLLPHAELGAPPVALQAPPHPSAFDWRTRGVVGSVGDQEFCGSCVSFATIGLVSTQAAIELGTHDLQLSAADQHFNSSHGPSCSGWNNAASLDQVRTRGVATALEFQYDTAFDAPPVIDPSTQLWAAHSRPEPLRSVNNYRIAAYHGWTGDDRKYYLANVGPLICGFSVYEDFDAYGGGVYRHVVGKLRGGHAVLVVGYSDVDQAWICRNSWGAGWGGAARPDGTGAGYFKIGYGQCGIDGEPMFGCTGVLPPKADLHIGLAQFGNSLFAGWKGMHGDDRMFFTSGQQQAWAGQTMIPGIGSSVGPSYAVFGGRLYAAWKGVVGDQAIWWSSFDGKAWAPQQRIGGVASSVGPTLAVFQNRLYAAWKGMNNDQGIYWSSFDGHNWAPQQRIGGVATSAGPSLAEYQGRLYAAWKGMNNDQAIWWSSFDGHGWAPQQRIPGVATSVGPTLAVFGNDLAAVWKGMDDDQHLWTATFSGTAWGPQSTLPGNSCPD